VADQHVIAEGTPEQLQTNSDMRVRQFLDGIADGPVPFRFPAGDYKTELLYPK
ncbi:phospholipid ABC transporter ATP-binding protein MlaF, partial [Yersinia pestis subsp. pestis]|nr:phospholipid ABC transporter ATP-binding protein MlaF [Yersinia pestis subsp. pestis]